MAKLFDIQDTTVAISDLTLSKSQGNVVHTGDYDLAGNLNVHHNLTINGTITADTFNVKNLITDNGSLATVGNWIYNTEVELNGKGFNWTYGLGQTQLLYKTGNRLWTNANVDLASGRSYSIDDIPVLSANALGGSVTHSSLTSVGTLNNLAVSGDANLGDFVFVNSTFNRLGIGTEEPSASLTILDNNIEIGIGSPSIGVAFIGTVSSHDVAITTDNLARITVKNSGEVNIGDPVNGGGVLNVYGTLSATSVVTDSRIDRTHPLQFSATKDTSIYGLGLQWSGNGATRQLIMMSGPDRIYSSENLGLADGKEILIGNTVILTQGHLGYSVTHSNLEYLGVLKELSVSGLSTLDVVSANTVQVGDIALTARGLEAPEQISTLVSGKEIVYGDANQINIGDSSLMSKPVKVFGKLSVGINNPDPDLNFSVNGDVSIGGKKFTNSATSPTSGSFQMGDICWNTNPQINSYVGWVCVVSGTPGVWKPFGEIKNQ